MPRKIGGKIFTSREELPPEKRMSDAEMEAARQMFAEANARRERELGDRPSLPKTEANRRMWDDLGGTEYEDWTYPGDDRPPRPSHEPQ
ncbi:hypothetical protein [Nocardia bovistercoris]|uniref:Uncharacterized protein n=1 Tax=Nocardia bovistercoris TaxID=2785916 RepID=A0A931N4S6_9NOCA|nr:hypothetical protein [Nocardia bovistercoris]MBH0778581.1 hypothetical protein [Nocardia bovistercoris]